MSDLKPIGYASGGFVRRQRDPLVVWVVVLSFCIAFVSILFSGLLGMQSFEEVSHARQNWQYQAAHARRAPALAPAPARVWVPPVKATTHPSSFHALTSDQISSAIGQIQSRLDSALPSPHLSAGQIQALTRLLSTQPQKLVDPDIPFGSEISGRLQIVHAWLSNDGAVTVTINRGSPGNIYRTRIDAEGHELPAPLISEAMPSQPLIAPTYPAFQPPVVVPGYSQQTILAEYSAMRFGANLLLDGVLIVAACLLLISSRNGVWLLWFYVAVKLSLVGIEGTPLLSMIVGSDLHDEIFGKVPDVASAIYPASLIFILRQRIFRTPALVHLDSSSSPGGLNESRPPSWNPMACLSLIVSIASIVLSALLLSQVIPEISEAARQIAAGNRQTLDSDFEGLYKSSVAMAWALAIMLILAIILFIGAISLWRSKRAGVTILWIYAVGQIQASVFFSCAFMWYIGSTPAGMEFFIGVFPGLIGCIYPVAVLFTLHQSNIPKRGVEPAGPPWLTQEASR